MDIVIYGAQAIALGTYQAVRKLYPERNVPFFLVTKRDINADTLAGIPVMELRDFLDLYSLEKRNNFEIFIATPEGVMDEIEEELRNAGLLHLKRMTSVVWSELMGRYYAEGNDFLPLSVLPMGEKAAELTLYIAKSHKDQKVRSKEQDRLPEWMRTVQVGAALTEKRISPLLDCTGDNISEKNGNYSELTALYWIWKNGLSIGRKGCYVGLSHYRRFIDLTEDDLKRLISNDIDAVFTYPMPYEPNMEAHHERYVKKEDWEAVLRALEEVAPEYAREFPKVLSQPYFINYNIFVAKECVFSAYCEWLFPILERTEDYSVPKGFMRNDRYIGYIAESLMTLYFFLNQKKFKIAYAGCRFLV